MYCFKCRDYLYDSSLDTACKEINQNHSTGQEVLEGRGEGERGGREGEREGEGEEGMGGM